MTSSLRRDFAIHTLSVATSPSGKYIVTYGITTPSPSFQPHLRQLLHTGIPPTCWSSSSTHFTGAALLRTPSLPRLPRLPPACRRHARSGLENSFPETLGAIVHTWIHLKACACTHVFVPTQPINRNGTATLCSTGFLALESACFLVLNSNWLKIGWV